MKVSTLMVISLNKPRRLQNLRDERSCFICTGHAFTLANRNQMIHIARKAFTAASLAVLTTTAVNAQTLVSGYNFGTSGANPLSTPYSANHGAGTLTSNFVSTDLISNVAYGTTVNAVSGDAAGVGLNLRNTSTTDNTGKYLQFSLDMTGYSDLVVSYATYRAANSIFTNYVWSYSTDGTSFTEFSTTAIVPASYGIQTVDFSSLSEIDGVSTVYLRMTMFSNGTVTGTAASNRLDNFQFNATAVPEPNTWAMAGLGLGAVFYLRRRIVKA